MLYIAIFCHSYNENQDSPHAEDNFCVHFKTDLKQWRCTSQDCTRSQLLEEKNKVLVFKIFIYFFVGLNCSMGISSLARDPAYAPCIVNAESE